ncbi:unnamed protein product [Closterium sp. NIES-54]
MKVICTDNGGEFIGADFEAVLKKKGIQHQLTVPYNPQQNRVAERFNQALHEGAHTLLGRAGLPDPFWVTALRQVALVKNRVLATVGDKQWVPYTKWYGSAPAVNMLRAYGCMVVFHVPKEKRGKLEASGRWGVHLGIAKDHKGWLVWDSTSQQLTVSRDVKFLESLYYKEWKQQQQKLPTTPLIIEADEVQRPSRQVQVTVSDEEISWVTEDGGELEVEQQQQQQQQQQDAPPRTQCPPDRPRRDVRPPNRLTYPSFGKPKVCDEDEIAHCYWAAVPEPKTLAETLSGPDAEKWKQSVKEEYDSLLENETWELCELPPGKKVISSKLIFRHKYGPDGELTRYKSRLVAKGFKQTKGKDFDEIFAPMGKGTTLRVMLGTTANRGWRIKKMDITTAFLNGIILEELYMLQPEGLDDGSGRVCRLTKAIYGLKQAPRAWRVEEMLEMQFKCSKMGDVNYYLGMHVERDLDKRVLRLHQRKYCEGLAEKYGLQDGGKPATPLPSGFTVEPCADEEVVGESDRKLFHAMVGALNYAANHTWPDIAFATSSLASVVLRPSHEELEAAKRLVYYDFVVLVSRAGSAPLLTPMEAPLQTLHMDVWCPARVRGQGHERYFLLVVDDYSRYTTVFPLRSKGEVTEYAAHQINLQPRVSLPETTPTLRWTGKVGDASVFRVLGSRAFVRDASADKLNSRAGPAPSGVSQVDLVKPVEVANDSGAARGAELAGAGPGGAEPEVAQSKGAEPGGAEHERVEPGGAEPGGAEFRGAEPGAAL